MTITSDTAATTVETSTEAPAITPAGRVGFMPDLPLRPVPDLPDSCVWLPTPGERVRVLGREMVWLGARLASTNPHRVIARVLEGEQTRELTMMPHDFEARRVVIGQVSADALAFVAALDALTEAHAEALARHQSWIDSLVEDLHEQANDRGFCGDFDDWMIDHGMPSRERTFTIPVDVTVRVHVSATGRTAEDACEAICTSDVREALRDADLSLEDWSADEDGAEPD